MSGHLQINPHFPLLSPAGHRQKTMASVPGDSIVEQNKEGRQCSNIPADAAASSSIGAGADSAGAESSSRRNSSSLRRSFSNIAPFRRESSDRNAADSGLRQDGSMSFSREVDLQLLEDTEDEIVAQAGDAGDRSLSVGRRGGSRRSSRFDVAPWPDDSVVQLQQIESWYDEGLRMNAGASSIVSPLPSEICSPLSPDPMLRSKSVNQDQAPKERETGQKGRVKKLQLYLSCRIHLATFGILGVLTRYLLQKLFGPGSIGFTHEGTTLYLDLPSNMVGSFLMGWLGIIFKGDISHFSSELAIGLTTGYLGSLTTFSGWNQKMLELALEGKWVLAVIGFSTDMLLVGSCVYVGVASAKGFRWLLKKHAPCNPDNCGKADHRILRFAILSMLILLWSLLWAFSIAFFKTKIKTQENIAQLWLACIVGPPGVWLRYFLASYNGRGLGKRGSMKWLPFGTLSANVLAAMLMASSTTIKKEVNTKRCDIVINGFQLGFLGCLSTVSTFVAEFYAMSQSKHPWRAYIYTILTIVPSFVLGTLVYIVPVRTKNHQ